MGNIKIGRTIAERREQLESSSARIAAQKKGKKKKIVRILLVSLLYAVFAGVLGLGIFMLLRGNNDEVVEIVEIPVRPTIEVIDEDAMATGGVLTSRMSEYIGQIEGDFRELGYTPIKAVVPMGSIREVDFYFAEFSGFVKTTIDRGAGVTAEDFDRIVRYLKGIGKENFEYIDARVEGRGYFK